MNCLNCKKLISNKATFCTDRCRKAYSRKSDKQVGQNSSQVGQMSELRTQVGQPEQMLPHCSSCNFTPVFIDDKPFIPNWFKYHLKGKVKSRADALEQIRGDIERDFTRISAVGLV